MKRTLLFIMAFLPMLASADAIEIDGIYYNLDSEAKTAEVTSRPNQYESDVDIPSSSNQYKGDVAIPESVTYDVVVYSVTSIGDGAFRSCSGLTSITIPSSVTCIGELAFDGCSGLTSVTIPNSVTSIGWAAFDGCSGLTSITIGDGVISIGDFAFSGCTSLTSITIPSSVTSIGTHPFFDCSGLQSIVVEKGNTVYDSREDCNAIIKTSDNELISGCTNSTIPNSVTKIGQSAFQNCKGLRSVRIPNSVVSIGQFAFQGCSGMTSITIPNSVTSIGSYAFRWCSGLTSITIPNSVTSIDEFVFYECSGLTSVTIPNSVTSIGRYAFDGCSGLTDVICYAKNVPTTPNDAFINSGIEKATLHVPAASISAYQATRPWKNFKEIVALKNQENMAYRPMIEDDKVWKVGTLLSGNPVQLVQYYYFDGDTIINGKICKQMMCQRYVNPDYAKSNNLSPYNSLNYVGAWYEEDKKVYEYDTTGKQFKLMYDFSLEDNGTFQINDLPYVYVVGPRKTGGIKGFKGINRDVLEWADGESYKCAPWLEGVGVIYGPPTTNIFNVELADPAWFLMSCSVGEEVIYLREGCEDGATPWEMDAKKHRFDFTHTIKTKPQTRSEAAEEKQPLYGEYSDQLLDINLDPLDEAYLVRITNESDQVVYEKTINAGSIVGLNIDISAFAKGRYTVTIENSGESFTGEFETLTTGIQEFINKEETKIFNSSTLQFFNSIYNLQGQRLNTLQKGLNIVNGRKVLVK